MYIGRFQTFFFSLFFLLFSSFLFSKRVGGKSECLQREIVLKSGNFVPKEA